MRRREKVNSAKASAASLPRIVCATRFSFCALLRSARRNAEASLSARRRAAACLPISGPLCPLVAGMAIKGAEPRELAEPVRDHVLGHQPGRAFMAVLDAAGQAD